jgi:hypothetical protein
MPRAKEIFLRAILGTRAKRSSDQLQVLRYHSTSAPFSFIHSPFSDATIVATNSLQSHYNHNNHQTFHNSASETRLLHAVESSTSIHLRDRMDQFLPKSQGWVSRTAVRDWQNQFCLASTELSEHKHCWHVANFTTYHNMITLPNCFNDSELDIATLW